MLQSSYNETSLQKKRKVLKNSLNTSYYTANMDISLCFKCLYLLQLEN